MPTRRDISCDGLIIAGPTASGKSALALGLAGALGGADAAVIINADSMQVYRELRVLTARPSPEDEARVPHRLYGVRSVAEACSAALWRDWAEREIDAARAAGRFPILVGGTGLYLRALTKGLTEIPEIPAEVRTRAIARHAALGGPSFRAELANRDAPTARRLHDGDPQRLIRAWEVVEATGIPLSLWQARTQAGFTGTLKAVIVDPPRDALYAGCDRRLEVMLRDGGLREVATLAVAGHDPTLPGMKALGVPEFRAFLAGRLDQASALARAQQATRRYAKRQVTWFRNQGPKDFTILHRIDTQLSNVNLLLEVRKIQELLLT